MEVATLTLVKLQNVALMHIIEMLFTGTIDRTIVNIESFVASYFVHFYVRNMKKKNG